MQTILLLVGCWLLLNMLFVLLALPPLKEKMPAPLISVMDAVKRLLGNHRD